VDGLTPDPVYIDYGMHVIYEGETVYVDNQPIPAAQYTQPMIELAVNAEQQPPPLPPAEGKQAEWMPLGSFALAQEEKGDPVMFFQLSVNREGAISGGYSSTLTNDQRPSPAGGQSQPARRLAYRRQHGDDLRDQSRESHAGRLAARDSLRHDADTNLAARAHARARARRPAAEASEAPKAPPPLKTAKAK
jgi:hypothetical protein